MKRFNTILAAGLIGAGLMVTLPETARAQADETIDINLNNVRLNGNLNLGIGLAGNSIANKVAQIGKPTASNVPTIPGTGTGKTTSKTVGTTTGNTNPKGNQNGNSLGNLGQMIGHNGGEHHKHHDQDHGRRPWDTRGHEHGASMIGSLHHHHEHEQDRHFAFNGDHRKVDGSSAMKQSGSANTKSTKSGTMKNTQANHLNNGNNKSFAKGTHTASAGNQVHHQQQAPAMHANTPHGTAHSAKTGKH